MNYCLNEKHELTTKEKMIEFAKGPCSPIMMIPGILSTKLRV